MVEYQDRVKMAPLTCSHLPSLVGKQVHTPTQMAGVFLVMMGSQRYDGQSTPDS